MVLMYEINRKNRQYFKKYYYLLQSFNLPVAVSFR